jgi:predicted transcriptional regulator
MTEDHKPHARLLNIVSDIVASYVSNNSVRSGDLAEIIGAVHSTLASLGSGQAAPAVKEVKAPAASIKKSITPDFLICLDDGKKFKSLRRHLSTAHNMSPDDYRAKWNLPQNYPMVAPAYAAERSALAKQSGLGQVRTKPAKAMPAVPRRRGRPKKVV